MRALIRAARGIVLAGSALSMLMACDFGMGSWGEAERCTPGEERWAEGWFSAYPHRQRCGPDGRWYGSGDTPDSGLDSSRGDGGATSGWKGSDSGPSCCSLRVVGGSSVEYDWIGIRAGTYEARVKMEPGAAPDGGEPEPAVVFGEAEETDASALDGWVAYCLPGMLRVDVSTASGIESVDAAASCDDRRFHHVVVTFDAVTTVFFDGVRLAEGAFVPAVKARTLHLGAVPWWPSTSVTTLDDVAVWDGTGPLRVRSHWSFDECTGSRAYGSNEYGATVSVGVDASTWAASCHP